tara:strand:- start:32 stop:292 length:261 start_codon:yes stop_codon:yes gene_type:complete
MKSSEPIVLTTKEFWQLYLKIKTDNLTAKELSIAADFWAGDPKPLKGNYKTYVEKIQKKGIPLKMVTVPKEITLEINVIINDELSN